LNTWPHTWSRNQAKESPITRAQIISTSEIVGLLGGSGAIIDQPVDNQSAMPSRLRHTASLALPSTFLLALAVFFAADFLVRATFPYWHHDRFCSPNRSWAWWAARDLEKRDKPPDIVLLGSSLMMSVVHDGDATFLNKTQDAVRHHRSYCLEHLLNDNSKESISTFSMAIGGQMASDAYAIATTLFSSPAKPKLIIYGIAPRDFIDSMFTDPASSETYRFMSRVSDADLMELAGHRSFWNKSESILTRVIFLYQKRFDFEELTQNFLRTAYYKLPSEITRSGNPTPPALREIFKFALPDDNSPDQWLANPYNPKTMKFRDNLTEYRQRYKLFKPKVYETQIEFMARLLSFCEKESIPILLVNMPITQENIRILPGGIYHRYISDIQTLSTQYRARFVDMNLANTFVHSDFADSVHVNGAGAIKFLEQLSKNLSLRSTIASADRHAPN
jgi:hypothetical protein